MKIGIMSDIHANAIALKAVPKDMKSIMPDMIIFLGDLLFNGTCQTGLRSDASAAHPGRYGV